MRRDKKPLRNRYTIKYAKMNIIVRHLKGLRLNNDAVKFWTVFPSFNELVSFMRRTHWKCDFIDELVGAHQFSQEAADCIYSHRQLIIGKDADEPDGTDLTDEYD